MHQLEGISQEQLTIQRPRLEGVRIDNIVVLALQDEREREKQQQRLQQQSYHISETPHFVVCQKQASNQVVLLHLFKQADIDADIICFLENELSPFGFMPTARAFGAALFAVIASPFPSPRNQASIWQHFCLNTLIRLREQIVHPSVLSSKVSYVVPFATIYRRIFDITVGQSFLDVGCSFGFLPVLMSEHASPVYNVGCDNNSDALRFSTSLASAVNVSPIKFVLKDVLSPDFSELGHFETVTAIHLLEHLSEQDLPIALTNLLSVTTRRLIIAVPYEEVIQPLYGHLQTFTYAKLHQWGEWCVKALHGNGHYWCEGVMGGLLVVERTQQT